MHHSYEYAYSGFVYSNNSFSKDITCRAQYKPYGTMYQRLTTCDFFYVECHSINLEEINPNINMKHNYKFLTINK